MKTFLVTKVIRLVYHHLLEPFKIACGAETNFGRLNLSHYQLLVFYKHFVQTIDGLTADCNAMITLDPFKREKTFN